MLIGRLYPSFSLYFAFPKLLNESTKSFALVFYSKVKLCEFNFCSCRHSNLLFFNWNAIKSGPAGFDKQSKLCLKHFRFREHMTKHKSAT
jgi:hypothetical protein